MDGSALRIGLIGWGTMGAALGELIATGPLPVELRCVAVRDLERARGRGLPAGVSVHTPEELVRDDQLDAVVELAGGIDQPSAWARAALERGRPYVTGNKALLATHGGELASLARERGGALLASASVGGATPMIELVEHLAASARIVRLRGLLNATTTFILAAMGEGQPYQAALAAAQRAGYAEPDPSFDVEGRDAAQKLAILASVAWARWRPEHDVRTQGIVGVRVPPGATMRLVAEASEGSLDVRPMELPAGTPMAAIAGIDGMLEVELRDGAVLRISGPGAGGPVSVGAVYADLARLVAGERPILFAPRGAAS